MVIPNNTSDKSDLAEAKVAADLISKGFQISIPYGKNARYDIILDNNGIMERVKARYAKSNGEYIEVKCRSVNSWAIKPYTSEEIEWLVVYDVTTDCCYYIPSSLLGDGKNVLNLRLVPTKNNQSIGVRWAKDYLDIGVAN